MELLCCCSQNDPVRFWTRIWLLIVSVFPCRWHRVFSRPRKIFRFHQIRTDLTVMPIEDGSIEWPQQLSPYRVVGKITIPPQEAYSPERRVYGDDILSFNPFHCILEHRPLGGIMRIRRHAYNMSSKFRHHMNAQQRVEPQSIDELPD